MSIGLDIGASAVRAAEVRVSNGRTELLRAGQVGLEPGAVSDGEIVRPEIVSEAIRRLWNVAGFSSRRVVLGVSGHRVIVRQAEVPALNDEDLRSALRFDSQELIPIPMDQAAFDFRVLGRGALTDGSGRQQTQILMVAGHRDLLGPHLDATEKAGLEVAAIDATALALLRLLPKPSDATSGARAVVSVGADITTIAVEESGVPRFVRSLAVGGAHLTAGVTRALHLDPDVAERLKREAGSETSLGVGLRKAVQPELTELAEEIRGTIDFFLGQTAVAPIREVVITGGGALAGGVSEVLRRSVPVPVTVLEPFACVTQRPGGLSEDAMDRLAPRLAGALGLALWATAPPAERLTILPEEVVTERKVHRARRAVIAGAAGVALVLIGASVMKYEQVRSARSGTQQADAFVATLTRKVAALQAETAVRTKVTHQHQVVVTALSGDVDWVRLLGGLASVMPPNLSLTSFSASKPAATAGGTSASSSAGAAASANQVSFSVQGSGGLPAVSAWLQALALDSDFSGTWVTGIAVSPEGTLSFTSNTDLTAAADSSRPEKVAK